DGEIVYRAQIETSQPFPHLESIEFTLSPTWQPRVLRMTSEHEKGKATYEGQAVEGRWEIEIVDGQGKATHYGFPYDKHTELDDLSPIFNIVTFQRLGLSPGHNREIQVIYMEPMVFTPKWAAQLYSRSDDEVIKVSAGEYVARHYRYRSLDKGWESDM
ncbi:MAG: putative glycolipid-binding domain-containing protein, partial [Chloroflexi bacterium]|nr:putative glycolipid-binding domain-containing protein [Chloroflexota bacterium]